LWPSSRSLPLHLLRLLARPLTCRGLHPQAPKRADRLGLSRVCAAQRDAKMLWTLRDPGQAKGQPVGFACHGWSAKDLRALDRPGWPPTLAAREKGAKLSRPGLYRAGYHPEGQPDACQYAVCITLRRDLGHYWLAPPNRRRAAPRLVTCRSMPTVRAVRQNP